MEKEFKGTLKFYDEKKNVSNKNNYISKNSSENNNKLSEQKKEKENSINSKDDKKEKNKNEYLKQEAYIWNNESSHINVMSTNNNNINNNIINNNIINNNIININNNNNNIYNNINNNNINNNKKYNIDDDKIKEIKYPFLYKNKFPFSCSQCKSEIIDILYFCEHCQNFYCLKCEEIEGPKHDYPFFKIGNQKQLNDLEKFKNNKNLNINDLNSFFGIFGNYNNKQNNIQLNNMKIEKLKLVELFKKEYELDNFSDNQIENALTKTKGDFGKAMELLFG